MDGFKFRMGMLLVALGVMVGFFSGCTTVPTTSNTRHAVLYAETSYEQLDQAGRLDSSHAASVVVGETYQLKDSKQEEGADDRMVGLCSDLGFSFGAGDATTGDVNLHTDRFSLNMGLRYYFDVGTRVVQPYIGAGFAPQLLHASSNVGDNEDGFAFTGYALAGVDFALGERWRIGVAYRKSVGAQFDLGDENRLNFNDSSFGLSLGYSF